MSPRFGGIPSCPKAPTSTSAKPDCGPSRTASTPCPDASTTGTTPKTATLPSRATTTRACQGRTNKEVAALADITENTLGRLIRGQAWGALPILIRLEQALQADLWCRKAHPDDKSARK